MATIFICASGVLDAAAEESPSKVGPGGVATAAVVTTVSSDYTNARLTHFDFLGAGGRRGFYNLEPLCTAPCTASLAPGEPYRIVAPGMTPSAVFRLDVGGSATVRAHGGSWPVHVAGTVLSILGAVYVPVGGGLLGAQATVGTSKSEALVPVGASFLGAGVLALAIGLPMLFSSGTTLTIERSPE